MKKFLLSLWGTYVIILLTLLIPSRSNAQFEGGSYSEAGITIGPSNFLGDLGGNQGKGTPFLKDNNFPLTKIMFGAHLSVYPNSWLGFRLAVNIGKLEGDDAATNGHGGLEEARRARNQNFRTNLYEAFVVTEVYPTVFFEEDPTDVYHKLRPYGLIGVGGFYMNPQGTDPATGQWVDLRPLHLEGQGFPEYPNRKQFSLWQMNIPMGVGVKYFLSDNVTLGVEVIHRKTFTDYVDGVSTNYIDPALFYKYLPLNQAIQAERMADKRSASTTRVVGDKRGDPTQNDAYYSFGFKLGFRLGGGDKSYRNSTRCPIIRF